MMATAPHRVVIVGSGFGGLAAAKKLRRADVEVTLISETTSHLFQPLLYQVATGVLSAGDIAPATRLILRKHRNTQVLLGTVVDIDAHAGTVTSQLGELETITAFDSLIVAAGARQSYFGNDHFAEHAPGMKTIEDALDLRARLLTAFERAELTESAEERARLLTFVLVGGGPTGVELAGQISELAARTLEGAFRRIDSRQANVVVVEGESELLPAMPAKLRLAALHRLTHMGIDVQLSTRVTDVDADGVTVRDAAGTLRRIEAANTVWTAGVQAGPLGKLLVGEADGTEMDHAGRVIVEPDLTIKGFPNVFVIGDLMSVPGVPGLSPAAIQSGIYAAERIRAGLAGEDPAQRKPFRYFDKGSMAAVSRFDSLVQIGRVQFGGVLGWLVWLAVHLYYLVGYSNRLITVISWSVAFLGRRRGHTVTTRRWALARPPEPALPTPRTATPTII
ncbi:NAD(P)/FAD-dependent oxidoreductase [Nocardia sp. NPDC088792]|uniref:NAD(P)/FAD-dependent oxidoreductase n=1 Tax=Nocardia sp. NPDC088792 TaxID=3364332 RepID=UPI0037FD222E